MATLSELKEKYERICRACMKDELQMKKIYNSEVDSVPISQMLSFATPINVRPDDGLPSSICYFCLNRLVGAYRFQQMCIHSDLQMRSAINNSQNGSSVSTSILNEIQSAATRGVPIDDDGEDNNENDQTNLLHGDSNTEQVDMDLDTDIRANVLSKIKTEKADDEENYLRQQQQQQNDNYITLTNSNVFDSGKQKNTINTTIINNINNNISSDSSFIDIASAMPLTPQLLQNTNKNFTITDISSNVNTPLTSETRIVTMPSTSKQQQPTMVKQDSSIFGYACSICTQVFDSEILLIYHRQTIPTCSKSMTIRLRKVLKAKKTTQKGITPSPISTDNKINQISKQPQSNQIKPRGKLYIKCNICSKIFSKGSEFDKHVSEIHSIPPAYSPYCNKPASSTKVLATTTGSIQGKLTNDQSNTSVSSAKAPVPTTSKISHKFCCNICKKVFYNLHELTSHLVTMHRSQHTICKPCNKLFINKIELDAHNACVHKNNNNASIQVPLQSESSQYVCHFCKKEFENPKALRVHMSNHVYYNTHTTRQPNSLKTSSNTEIPMNSQIATTSKNSNQLPIEANCVRCQQGFKTRDEILSHLNLHHSKHADPSNKPKEVIVIKEDKKPNSETNNSRLHVQYTKNEKWKYIINVDKNKFGNNEKPLNLGKTQTNLPNVQNKQRSILNFFHESANSSSSSSSSSHNVQKNKKEPQLILNYQTKQNTATDNCQKESRESEIIIKNLGKNIHVKKITQSTLTEKGFFKLNDEILLKNDNRNDSIDVSKDNFNNFTKNQIHNEQSVGKKLLNPFHNSQGQNKNTNNIESQRTPIEEDIDDHNFDENLMNDNSETISIVSEPDPISIEDNNEKDIEEAIQCEICGKIMDKSVLDIHIINSHGCERLKTETKLCLICCKSFDSLKDLFEHKKSHMIKHSGTNKADNDDPLKPTEPSSELQNLNSDHHLNVSDKTKFTCRFCDEFFDGNFYLQRHLRLYHFKEMMGSITSQITNALKYDFNDEIIFTCKTCGNYCEGQENFISHLNKHLYIFQKEFKRRRQCIDKTSELNNSKASMAKNFRCELCGKLVAKDMLQNHYMSEHCEEDNQSDKISETNVDQSIKINKNELSNDKKLKCPICDDKFTKSELLKRHLKMVHIPIDITTENLNMDGVEKQGIQLKCDLCTNVFNLYSSLIRHKKAAHEDKEKNEMEKQWYGCKICKKKFIVRSNYEAHKKLHQPMNKPVNNEDKTENNIKKQQKIVAETNKAKCKNSIRDKSYRCLICKSKNFKDIFGNIGAYWRHFRYAHFDHIQEKVPDSNQCSLCTQIFVKKSLLEEHMKLHIVVPGLKNSPNQPAFSMSKKCKLCNKFFSSASSVRQHLRKVHKKTKEDLSKFFENKIPENVQQNNNLRRIYKCKQCSKKLLTYNAFKSHYNSLHKMNKNTNKYAEPDVIDDTKPLKKNRVTRSSLSTTKSPSQSQSSSKSSKKSDSPSILNKKHACKYCGNLYCRNYDLLRHVKMKHRKNLTSSSSEDVSSSPNKKIKLESTKEVNLSCAICGKKFKTVEELRRDETYHDKGYKNPGDFTIRCKVCGKYLKDDCTLYHFEVNHLFKEQIISNGQYLKFLDYRKVIPTSSQRKQYTSIPILDDPKLNSDCKIILEDIFKGNEIPQIKINNIEILNRERPKTRILTRRMSSYIIPCVQFSAETDDINLSGGNSMKKIKQMKRRMSVAVTENQFSKRISPVLHKKQCEENFKDNIKLENKKTDNSMNNDETEMEVLHVTSSDDSINRTQEIDESKISSSSNDTNPIQEQEEEIDKEFQIQDKHDKNEHLETFNANDNVEHAKNDKNISVINKDDVNIKECENEVGNIEMSDISIKGIGDVIDKTPKSDEKSIEINKEISGEDNNTKTNHEMDI